MNNKDSAFILEDLLRYNHNLKDEQRKAIYRAIQVLREQEKLAQKEKQNDVS